MRLQQPARLSFASSARRGSSWRYNTTVCNQTDGRSRVVVELLGRIEEVAPSAEPEPAAREAPAPAEPGACACQKCTASSGGAPKTYMKYQRTRPILQCRICATTPDGHRAECKACLAAARKSKPAAVRWDHGSRGPGGHGTGGGAAKGKKKVSASPAKQPKAKQAKAAPASGRALTSPVK